MGKGSNIWDRMKEQTVHSTDAALYRTIIEIAGDQRVLIENHRGVVTYGREKIIVKVKYGAVSVCGCSLEMTRMSREQLVIFGRIQSVSLHRRESA